MSRFALDLAIVGEFVWLVSGKKLSAPVSKVLTAP